MARDPIPPKGVVVHLGATWLHPEGRHIPVECVYAGPGDQGQHVWVATWPIQLSDARRAHITVDELPDNTDVTLTLLEPEQRPGPAAT